MLTRTRPFVVGFCLAAVRSTALAQWTPAAPGIDYQEFIVAGPNNVYVARMDRGNLDCTIDSMIAQGRLTGGTETVSSMATRHEDAIGYWGQTWGTRYDLVVAVNGDFYSSGIPTGGQISGGWYAKRFGDLGGASGFAWQLDRDAFIGECVYHIPSKQKVTYLATGQSQELDGLNRTRGSNELILYTHHYDLTTLTDNSGAEVLVKLSRPAMILPPPSGAVGTVIEIRPNAGSTLVPFDHVVLSAQGSAATTLLANVTVGAEVRIAQEITHYEHDCSTPYAWDWTKTYSSIGGSFHFLKDSVIQPSSDPGATQRHPRTAIAFDSSYIYFIVVDGRSTQSVGMSMTELGTFCIDYLAAVEGLNQDGGGSSTMWLNGTVMNVPSDGSERAVANGLFMATVAPVEQSTRFSTGALVRATGSAALRVGPGINYNSSASVAANTEGIVLEHALNGLRASNTHWWYCAFPSGNGWVADSSLLESGCAGDYTGDGRVDAADLPPLAYCLRGPGLMYNPGTFCLGGDSDADRDVDAHDLAVIQTCITAP